MVPDKTPPFVVIEITNGINYTKFVQLQRGVKRESYGNVLDEYMVNNYCDTYKWDKVKGQEYR